MRVLEWVSILIISSIAIAQTYSHHSFSGVADGMRYLASGHSLILDGTSYSAPAGYKIEGITRFPEKPYAYPSQLLQVIVGSLIVYAGLSPNISTLMTANAIAFVISLFIVVAILKKSMKGRWAVAGAAFIALGVPQYSMLMLNYATEPWMMLFILAVLLSMVDGRYYLAGVFIGLGFFFRAQIISILPAAALGVRREGGQRLMPVVTGCAVSGVAVWLLLKVIFPASGESTSGFYGRVFLQKYQLSAGQAFSVISNNPVAFKWLLFSLIASILIYSLVRVQKWGGVVEQVSAFYMTSTIVMSMFAFYMAGTVGDGVSDRYFVHLICLFWLTWMLAVAKFASVLSLPARSLRINVNIATVLLIAASIIQIKPAEVLSNFKAEDFPAGFFQRIPSESIIMTSYGAPVVSLQVDTSRVVYVPAYQQFIAGNNSNIDFIFLDSRRDSIPSDWEGVWNSEKFEDAVGVTFRLQQSFDSPVRSSRLFSRIQD